MPSLTTKVENDLHVFSTSCSRRECWPFLFGLIVLYKRYKRWMAGIAFKRGRVLWCDVLMTCYVRNLEISGETLTKVLQAARNRACCLVWSTSSVLMLKRPWARHWVTSSGFSASVWICLRRWITAQVKSPIERQVYLLLQPQMSANWGKRWVPSKKIQSHLSVLF